MNKYTIKQKNMKTTIFLVSTIVILSSCSSKNSQSDAYGNFETVEVLVSSEIQGKLLQFSIEEGKNYKAGDAVGQIDTVQLALKRDQLVAQRNASATKISNILSQIAVQEETKGTLLIDKARTERLMKDKAIPVKQLDDIN